ncbi:MAG TPA: DUF3662 and FHA domain-containing protein [Solirubrobacteraceae bacterium]
MNALRTLENMIAGLVEGTFGRVFKAEVRPIELARKLAREMDENKTSSVSRVYAPNEYSVWLSPRDRARYDGVEHEVIDELCAYLLEHARGEDLALASRPQITFHTDEDLQLGEFGIEARLVRPEESSQESEERSPPAPSPGRRVPAEPPRDSITPHPDGGIASAYEGPDRGGNTMIFSNSRRVRDAVEQTGRSRRPKALLVVSGRRLLVAPRGATIGRSRDCDVVLEDSSVSRRHAELRPGGAGWTIDDLGSTNGVRVNGLTVAGAHEVRTGDRIEIGSTEMLFELAP